MLRVLDLIFSLLGIIFLFPLFIFLWFVVRFSYTSPLFKQLRVCRNQQPFVLIKFRTMPLNTKSISTHLIKNVRMKPFGIFLREIGLDEIPQLWNVLIGEMSLVGPRPCLFSQKKLMKERKKRGIFKVRPGITGLAQVKGIDMSKPILLAKTELKMIKKLNLFYYFYYIIVTIFLIFKKK